MELALAHWRLDDAGMASNGALAKAAVDGNTGVLTVAFGRMVYDSFQFDKSTATDKEIARRMWLCINIFKELRGDLHYSMERALDCIPTALRAKLDGIPWEPSRRSTWITKDDENEGVAVQDGEFEQGNEQDGPRIWTPERARYGIV